jgi:hypothetical protein
MHPAKVDDDATLAECVSSDTVSATPNGYLTFRLPPEPDRSDDVLDARALSDGGWAPVDHGVVDRSRIVVARLSGQEDVPGEPTTKIRQR